MIWCSLRQKVEKRVRGAETIHSFGAPQPASTIIRKQKKSRTMISYDVIRPLTLIFHI